MAKATDPNIIGSERRYHLAGSVGARPSRPRSRAPLDRQI
jgi:hypothetical protein